MAIELKGLTKRQENYSQWYNELVVKADLAEQSAVRGCMVIKPYGYAIWEKMQQTLDRMKYAFCRPACRTHTSRCSSPNRSCAVKPNTLKALPRNVPW